MINKNEYITIETHKHLIGKKARFKDNLAGYGRKLWKAKGTIKQLEGVEHIGLSLVFDKPIMITDNLPMNSCYISPNSYELI